MSAFMSAALSLLTNDMLAQSAAAREWRMIENDFSPKYKLCTGDHSSYTVLFRFVYALWLEHDNDFILWSTNMHNNIIVLTPM